MSLSRATTMSLGTFKNRIAVAALVGLLVGLLLTLVQQFQVIPQLLEAEQYEQAAGHQLSAEHDHAAADHGHEHGGWQPAEGWERTLFTAGANIVVAFGFTLLLGALVTLRNAKLTWRSGLLWGLGGYAVFFVAPSLGLPPELPGTESAALMARQLWWGGTVIATASALWLIVFSPRTAFKILGVVVLIAPHLIGAPQPDIHVSTAPAELVHAFVVATAIANALFWLSLGALYGLFQKWVD
ncbi:MAG: CbtA family protein [Gammaproteobacteria bacterium]